MTLAKKAATLTLLGIAMAFLEAAVVIYLRALYYPNGFSFPLAPIDSSILKVEVLREIATIVMLVCVGILSGRDRSEKVAWFIYSFAIWDIFYYVFLKVCLDWPSSLFSWDILFLIPTMWVGPVLAPLILSATMIVLAITILHFSTRIDSTELQRSEWMVLMAGSAVVIVSFCLDFWIFLLSHPSQGDVGEMFTGGNASRLASQYIPDRFDWLLFCIGELLLLYAVARLARRYATLASQHKRG